MASRIQRKRVKGWVVPPNTVYIGRPGKWGNPFKVGEVTWLFEDIISNPFNAKETMVKDIDQCLRLYREYLEREVKFKRLDLEELRGKNLMCWCREGDPCHGDILLELTNK